MDATRLSDGIHVTLKTVDTSVHPFEVEIAQFLSSGQVAHDPRNHCVPILDVLQDPVEPNTAILVMPLLMSFQQSEFETVGEVIAFCKQVFEVRGHIVSTCRCSPLYLTLGTAFHARQLRCSSVRKAT